MVDEVHNIQVDVTYLTEEQAAAIKETIIPAVAFLMRISHSCSVRVNFVKQMHY